MKMKSVHKAVLSNETIQGLSANITEKHADVIYLDGTLGGAGHAMLMAEKFSGNINIIGLDRDEDALEMAKDILSEKASKVILENENFRDLDKVLDKHGIKTVDMILLDIGISSDQLDTAGKGFSFLRDEPLLMTMGDPEKYYFTAKDIVNKWKEEDIANVIFGYGEERFARKIAKAIVSYRYKKEIETSAELAEIVKNTVPAFYRRSRIHPATKTFQALRIAVNDELESLKQGLSKGYERLKPGGRLAVITFHSIEDRIVKNFFKSIGQSAKIITKKPIRPTEDEINKNPRSRSAKLRIIEKTFQNK